MLSDDEIKLLNQNLVKWVNEVAEKTKPDKIFWCDGSEEENREIVNLLVSKGQFIRLNEREYSNCYLYRTNENDVARVEDRTFICTENSVDAGPTNNWMEKKKALEMLYGLLAGIMKGRIMYVVPYLMGPINSDFSQVGIEITDSAYVVANMYILTRMGKVALNELGKKKYYIKAVHSTGDLDIKKRYICHFPDERLLISVNTAYGGNAILSKKPHALRLASVSARNEGWLAEHMFILEIENTEKKYYISGALPSASGKTNLAMIKPPKQFKEFKARTVGDDIGWLFPGNNGELRAINPENGFFGVAYGTGNDSNPNIMDSLKKNTLFTNIALNPKDNTPWWEGLSEPPKILYDWRGKEWYYGSGEPAAHKNSRFTTPIWQYKFKSEEYEDSSGVGLSAIIFGGRRSSLLPLIYEAKDFRQGILMGAMIRAETTAAQSGDTGIIRSDPMAMLAFCGYNMGDYFKHWFDVFDKIKKRPKFFNVNWFRKDIEGNYIWPGFSENFRVLDWILKRIDNEVSAAETPIGFIPNIDDINMTGLNIDKEKIRKLFEFDKVDGLRKWKKWKNSLIALVTIFQRNFGRSSEK